MTELLVLDQDWFADHQDDSTSIKNLHDIVNKGFFKSNHKFHVLSSPRVKAPETFISQFGIFNLKAFYFVVLLAPKTTFDNLKEKDQYSRDFSRVSKTLEESLDADLPQEYVDLFPIGSDSTTIIRADKDFVFDDSTTERTLAASCFYVEEKYEEGLLVVGLGSLVSYVRNGAARFIPIAVENFLMKELDVPNVRIQIDCIEEQHLHHFYHKKLQFKFSDIPDMRCELIDGELQNCPFKDDIVALRSFTLKYLHRDFYRK